MLDKSDLAYLSALETTIEQYKEERKKLQKEIEKQSKIIEVLRSACEFYGREMSYSIDSYEGISGEMRSRVVLYSDSEERNDVYSYAGKRARQALIEVERINNN